MLLEQAIYERLSGDAGVTALCGTRIYPHVAPQACETPYIVHARMEGDNLATLNGRGQIDRMQVAFGCVATDPIVAQSVALAVRNALDGYTSGGVIQAARRAAQRSEYMDEVQMHVVTNVYIILAAE